MALADFFSRDAAAISQVLQGFQTDTFIEKLEGVRVAVAFGEATATSRDGRALLDLFVRLVARLYPKTVVRHRSSRRTIRQRTDSFGQEHQP